LSGRETGQFTIYKTLLDPATNCRILKGLSLIAQFGFQRAAGVATQNLPALGLLMPSLSRHKKPLGWFLFLQTSHPVSH
jgi:hypothetical protein